MLVILYEEYAGARDIKLVKAQPAALLLSPPPTSRQNQTSTHPRLKLTVSLQFYLTLASGYLCSLRDNNYAFQPYRGFAPPVPMALPNKPALISSL